MWYADEVFGADDVSLDKFTDAAGIIRMKEREPMRKILERFEARFPQLFVSIYLGAFEELESLRQFGFWMLNRAAYVDVDLERPNENGILIVVDVNAKNAGITFGYALLPYLDEDSAFAALAAGHPSFLQGHYLEAIATVIQKLEGTLIKGWKKVKKDPESILAEGGQNPKRVGELLQRPQEGNQLGTADQSVKEEARNQ